MDAIVLKALNKNPLNRYQTAAEMRSDLVRALSGQAVQATPLMTRRRAHRADAGGARPGRRRRLAAAARAADRGSVADEDWEPDEADRSKRVWGFVGIGVLCVALLAGAIWLTLRVISAPPPAALVAVPDLSGMSLEQATAQLRDSRLTLGTVSRRRVHRREQGQGGQPATVQPDPGRAGFRGQPGDRQGGQPDQRAQRGQLHPGGGAEGA